MIHHANRHTGRMHVSTLTSPSSPFRYEYNATVKMYLVYVGDCRFAGITDKFNDGHVFAYLTNDPKNPNLARRWFCESLEDARQTLENSFEAQRDDPVWQKEK
jgi:hypothetical protein